MNGINTIGYELPLQRWRRRARPQDKLDMEMHQLLRRMERFADMIPSSSRSDRILQASGALRGAAIQTKEGQ